jgi:hypothetical protein
MSNGLLKLLLSLLLLYFALPEIQDIGTSMSALFWACWLLFFLLVFGANLGEMLRLKQSNQKLVLSKPSVYRKQIEAKSISRYNIVK